MKVGITGLNAPQNYFRLAFKGYFYDKALKLYYLMSRYYDPETGRFISPDSARYLDPTVFGGLNLFAYCHNRPLNVCDVKIASAQNPAPTNNESLDINQVLLVSAGAIGDILDIAGTALDFVRVLKRTEVFGTFNKILTGISAGLDLLKNITQDFDIQQAFYSVSQMLASYLSSSLGMKIGLLIGGLPGAIFGTIFSILFAVLFDELTNKILNQLFGK